MQTALETSPITFPARPINGGPLNVARPKVNGQTPETQWFYEPKYNGWRATVHVPTGTMFNRHNEPLSIAEEFSEALRWLRQFNYEWLDCEALERRHNVGRGALIILDSPSLAHLPYYRRREILERDFLMLDYRMVPRHNSVYLPLALVINGSEQRYWEVLMDWNRIIKAESQLTEDFYEGAVAKRGDSIYPIQLRSAAEEFAFWMKHRWSF